MRVSRLRRVHLLGIANRTDIYQLPDWVYRQRAESGGSAPREDFMCVSTQIRDVVHSLLGQAGPWINGCLLPALMYEHPFR